MIDRIEIAFDKATAHKLKELFTKEECTFCDVYTNTVEVGNREVTVDLKIFSKLKYAFLYINPRGLEDTTEMTIQETKECLDCILQILEEV
jgi:hypothetical protein